MNDWMMDILPYILGIAVATGIVILRPLGRRLAPLYIGRRGAVALMLTWLLGATGVWAALALVSRSLVLAIVLMLVSALAGGLSLLAYRDARRDLAGPTGQRLADGADR